MQPTVVIAEDDSSRRAEFAAALRRRGFVPLEAGSSEEALWASRGHLPQAVVVSLDMPILEGWLVVTGMKRGRQTSTIPIVAIARSQRGARERALRLGCTVVVARARGAAGVAAAVERAVRP